MSEEKKEFKVPKNRLGYVSKSQNGNILITVEQDMVLKKGDKLMQRKPADNIESLVANGVISEDEGDKRKASLEKNAPWKLYEVDLLPPLKK